MIIEAGKFYRTANGEKIGPMVRESFNSWTDNSHRLWCSDGLRYFVGNRGDGSNIIAEWTDEPTGPVRTVARKEVVHGIYGRLSIQRQTSPESEPRILINLAGETGQVLNVHHSWSRAELRTAIATMTEIADALDEQENGRAAK